MRKKKSLNTILVKSFGRVCVVLIMFSVVYLVLVNIVKHLAVCKYVCVAVFDEVLLMVVWKWMPWEG